MNTFTIDINNHVAAYDADVTVSGDTVKLMNEPEFAAAIKDWPTARLIELWNKLPNVTPVTKFTDRKTALRRIWAVLEKIEPGADREPAVKPKAPGKKKPVAKAKALANAKPAAKAKSAGRTKTDQVIAALREPAGATLKQLMAITGWQPHSVRGFLSAHVSKRMGLRVKSIERDGVRVYRVPS